MANYEKRNSVESFINSQNYQRASQSKTLMKSVKVVQLYLHSKVKHAAMLMNNKGSKIKI